jgi:hypothetical protein
MGTAWGQGVVALDARGKLQNVYLSLDDYFSSTLVDTEGFRLQKHGVVYFIPPTSAAWVRLKYDMLGTTRIHYRHATATTFGTEVTGVATLSILQETRSWSTQYTLVSARDQVVAHLPEGKYIPIKDYTESNVETASQVGSILMGGINEMLIDDGRESGLVNYEIEASLVYLESYTR